MLTTLVSDHDRLVRRVAALAFTATMKRAPMLERLQIAVAWATAEASSQRCAVALALADHMPCAADRMILSHLAADPDSSVREAALAVALRRFERCPNVAAGIADLCANDLNPVIRALVRAMHRVAQA